MQETAEGAECDSLEKIVINNDLERFFQVGAQLSPWEKEDVRTYVFHLLGTYVILLLNWLIL